MVCRVVACVCVFKKNHVEKRKICETMKAAGMTWAVVFIGDFARGKIRRLPFCVYFFY